MEKIKAEEIEAVIERKKIRNIYISVNSATGEVSVSAPLKAARDTIDSFFASKLGWIRKHRIKILSRPPKINNTFSDGEKVEVFGKTYTLKIFDYAKKPEVFLTFDSLHMYISAKADTAEREEAIYSFYEAKLKEAVPVFILKWEKKLGIYAKPRAVRFLLKKIRGVLNLRTGEDIEKESIALRNPVGIVYKKMKGRWGSCNISDKKITLNTELAKKSLRCVEYVTAHELLHLKERRHNKRFRDYMRKAFPDWKKLEAELEGYV